MGVKNVAFQGATTTGARVATGISRGPPTVARSKMTSGLSQVLHLFGRPQLTAIGRAFRHESQWPSDPSPPDQDLLDIVERPFTSVPDAHERLTELRDRLRDAADRRAIFLTIYSRMTRAVNEAIEEGHFADASWMRRYTITFANYYRRAFQDFERAAYDAVPEPWMIAFVTATESQGLAVQDAFLGINAHINYDLGLTLYDVGIDSDRQQKRADHQAINGILASIIDAQQEALAKLYAPGLETIDETFGRFDEQLTLFSLEQGRAQAWRFATVFTDVEVRPVARSARWVHRMTATGSSVFIRSPPLDQHLLRALSAAERDHSNEEILTQLDARL